MIAVDWFGSITGVPCSMAGPLTEAVSIAGACNVATGDSGGPAYSYNTDGSVSARGTITAGNLMTPATCPGLFSASSNTVWYAPLLRPTGDGQIGSLQYYNTGILTS
jgi:hypothetical protein